MLSCAPRAFDAGRNKTKGSSAIRVDFDIILKLPQQPSRFFFSFHILLGLISDGSSGVESQGTAK